MAELDIDKPLAIGGAAIAPGTRASVELQVTRLPTGTWVSIPVAVVRGRRSGPCVWVSAAIHGDELNGVEVVRRLLPRIPLPELRGTVVAVPVVNVFGVLHQDRYLPDRRDLNRSFPGSPRGSLAARLAHLFMSEIVEHCQYGIDLHTGSNHRTNFPQIRANLDDPATLRLAKAFRAPLTIHADSREGSLRHVAGTRGRPVLVYEAGETLRFDRESIEIGTRGILRVLQSLDMIDETELGEADPPTRLVQETRWVRAGRGGILLVEVRPGEAVSAGQVLAHVTDTFSGRGREIRAPFAGTVIGLTTNPLVNRGDAVVHLAAIRDDSL